MTNAEAFNLIVGTGAAVATGLATLAAFRSARSAELAQAALREYQQRSSRRDVAQLVAACSFEFRRIQFLAHTLQVINRSNAIFSGNLGGSRQKIAEDGLTTRVSRADGLFQAASPFVEDAVASGRLTEEDIDRLQPELTIKLSELRSIAEELTRESTSAEAQLLQHRERAIMRDKRDA